MLTDKERLSLFITGPNTALMYAMGAMEEKQSLEIRLKRQINISCDCFKGVKILILFCVIFSHFKILNTSAEPSMFSINMEVFIKTEFHNRCCILIRRIMD